MYILKTKDKIKTSRKKLIGIFVVVFMPQCLFTFYLDIIFQTHCFSLVMNFLTLVKVLRLNY